MRDFPIVSCGSIFLKSAVASSLSSLPSVLVVLCRGFLPPSVPWFPVRRPIVPSGRPPSGCGDSTYA